MIILTHVSGELYLLTLPVFCMNVLLLDFIFIVNTIPGEAFLCPLLVFQGIHFQLRVKILPLNTSRFPHLSSIFFWLQYDIWDRIIGAYYTNCLLQLPCDLPNDYQFSFLLTCISFWTRLFRKIRQSPSFHKQQAALSKSAQRTGVSFGCPFISRRAANSMHLQPEPKSRPKVLCHWINYLLVFRLHCQDSFNTYL